MKKQKLKSLQADFLRSSLRRLPDKVRIAVILRFWHMETVESIAKYLGISYADTCKLLDSGIKQLRKKILFDHKFN